MEDEEARGERWPDAWRIQGCKGPYESSGSRRRRSVELWTSTKREGVHQGGGLGLEVDEEQGEKKKKREGDAGVCVCVGGGG